MDDATLIAHMEEMEEDALLANAANDGERQMVLQQQVGGSVTSREPGRFNFTLNPYVDRVSTSMGVWERHYVAHLQQ